MEEMVERTSGKDCGKQDGDYLSWANSSWSLHGNAKWMDVSVEDLCRKDSSIQLFLLQTVSGAQDCKNLCPKLHNESRMASVETRELFDKLKDRMTTIKNFSGKAGLVMWLPLQYENNVLVDSVTGNEIAKPLWNPGYPIADSSRSCAAYGTGDVGYVNWPCVYNGDKYCGCHSPEQPFLSLRGLCKDSHIDQTYLPQNSHLDGELAYFGNTQTYARFLREENQWKIEMFLFNTTAVSQEISKRFMLGKQRWTITEDNKKCRDGKPYTTTLKLTGCKEEGEFTCDDGQCIEMERRCDQVTGNTFFENNQIAIWTNAFWAR